MRVRGLRHLAALILLCPGARAAGETLRDVTFDAAGESSSNAELMRRLVSPQTAQRFRQSLKSAGKALAAQPLTPSSEHFLVYVPAHTPERGYGLLVFVPPWQDARLPAGWSPVLDRYGIIFVTAARSGNDESVMSRREPLALLAADNIGRQYHIDPDRTYVSGFSGGSRVALRLALGYPDLFRGAILNAASNPIGTAEIPLPPMALFERFQHTSRLVYLTGERDVNHQMEVMSSVSSLHHWCVFNLDDFTQPGVGHDVASAAALSRALGALYQPSNPTTARLARCQSRLTADLDTNRQRLQRLRTNGERAAAAKLAASLDERYGGLLDAELIEAVPQ